MTQQTKMVVIDAKAGTYTAYENGHRVIRCQLEEGRLFLDAEQIERFRLDPVPYITAN